MSSLTPARKRLLKDFKRLQKEPPEGIMGSPIEGDIMQWSAVIFGPEGTPFEDGTFKLSLSFTEDYPNRAPKVKFVSRIFHPNVYKDGSICLDILQNRWSPTYNISGILTSIQSLLDEPNPNSPANGEAAQLFRDNKHEYEKRVRECVEETWSGDEGEDEEEDDDEEDDEEESSEDEEQNIQQVEESGKGGDHGDENRSTVAEKKKTGNKAKGWYVKNSAATHAMAVLAARYAQHAPDAFVEHASTILHLIDANSEDELPKSLVATCMASLAVFCKSLGQKLLPLFPRIIPHVISAVNACVDGVNFDEMAGMGGDTRRRNMQLLTSSLELSLVCIQQYTTMFSTSLSPFLAACCHPRLCSRGVGIPDVVVDKADRVRDAIAEMMPPRLLIQILPPCYKNLCRIAAGVQGVTWTQRGVALESLFAVLKLNIHSHSQADFKGQIKPLFRFFATALQFRALVWAEAGVGGLFVSQNEREEEQNDRSSVDEDGDGDNDSLYSSGLIDMVEGACLQSFTQLVMTLSDDVFRPYFLHFVDWASKKTATTVTGQSTSTLGAHRVVTLAHMVEVLSTRLKRYFTPYFTHVLRVFTSYLENQEDCLSLLGVDASVMVKFVCSSLSNCFLYDTEGFVTPDRFNSLISSLGAQFAPLAIHLQANNASEDGEDEDEEDEEDGILRIDETDDDMYTRLGEHVIPCLVSLADSLGDEDKLKALNKVVVRACTEFDPRVRVCGVRALLGLYEQLGEEMNATLPDTVSILTELIEDPDETVEKTVHKLMQEIERHLTEPLANYLK
eukprot:m.4405 g.4405  ORF g.4405 m.4405 type:complete len:789 (-) comp3876_c0_seq1:852-3218(-)